MRAIAIRAGMVAGLAVLVTAGSASAATLKVTKTSDPVPGACTANDCSLREAIRRANSTGTADKILLKAKTYELAQAGEDDDALAGDLDVVAGSGRLTVSGKGRGKTAVDGGDLDRIFQIADGAGATIRELTVRNGSAPTGGAILNTGALTIGNAAVRDS